MSADTYRQQIARRNERRSRRDSFSGADGPAPTRTPEEQAAHKAERRAAWLETQPKPEKPKRQRKAKDAAA